MRLYLDTEFNGFGGELISLALVTEDRSYNGFDWYAVLPLPSKVDPWVLEHVVPRLDKTAMPPHKFKFSLHNFLRGYENPEIICDWYADAEHFCRCLAGDDYGSSLDFSCRITILKTPPNAYVSKQPHNALDDARALRDWHAGLEKAA